jgi:hypothetical protein
MGKNIARKYLIRSRVNPALVLCTDGEFHAEVQVGPGGWCAKIYKTERGADASAAGRGTVEEMS